MIKQLLDIFHFVKLNLNKFLEEVLTLRKDDDNYYIELSLLFTQYYIEDFVKVIYMFLLI